MSTIGERIATIIKVNGMNQRQFAETINVSEPAVSNMRSGKISPSKQSIGLICDKFNVNRDWLLTGEGEMFTKQGRDDELAKYLGDLMKEVNPTFKHRLVSALVRLDDPAAWDALEQLAKDIVAEKKEDTP